MGDTAGRGARATFGHRLLHGAPPPRTPMAPPLPDPDSERTRLELEILASELDALPPEPPAPADEAPPDAPPPAAPPPPPGPALPLLIRRKP